MQMPVSAVGGTSGQEAIDALRNERNKMGGNPAEAEKINPTTVVEMQNRQMEENGIGGGFSAKA